MDQDASGKSGRLVDGAILLAVLALIAGAIVRLKHPDVVSNLLTDLSRREEFTVEVALPSPWRREPLVDLPRPGDAEVPEGDRDRASFVRLERGESDTSYPKAVFRVRARVDRADAAWYNYGALLPGASFAFKTDRYAMEGVILSVSRASAEK